MTHNRTCLNCQKSITGRSDKKYCDDYCKSNFNYEKNKLKEKSLFKKIDLQLKKNRKILRDYNLSGKSVVRKERLEATGFNPNFFTHYWKNNKGQVYLFCYEFGFLKLNENGKTKYVLVEWQPYMSLKK